MCPSSLSSRDFVKYPLLRFPESLPVVRLQLVGIEVRREVPPETLHERALEAGAEPWNGSREGEEGGERAELEGEEGQKREAAD